jgi:hypothetical protein
MIDQGMHDSSTRDQRDTHTPSVAFNRTRELEDGEEEEEEEGGWGGGGDANE